MSTSYADLLGRLNRASVNKHFDAYADVDWDNPEHAIDPEDPRWIRAASDPLGATDWYKSQPEGLRAQLGLHMIVQQMKVGALFENVLSRGLLEMISALPHGAPEARYAYHEVIEESQHSLMFLEFVNRSGLEAPGLSGWEALGARTVPRLGRVFPELFFLFVLGGEEPIDFAQRESLENGEVRHPLLERIMRIHVTEEARHLCFARAFLRERVPHLSPFAMWHLRVRTPILLYFMSRQMLEPPKSLVAAYRIPEPVVQEAYRKNPAHHARVAKSLFGVRTLCAELGLLTPELTYLWTRLGIGPDPTAAELPSRARGAI